MKILGLIPARGGSKRLPSKNKMYLGEKPLINWSIESANGITEICDLLVSTDDPEIASIAKKAGAFVPWLRPSNLATDEATSVDVALHALNWYEKEFFSIDGLLLLQPTSPFRRKNTIQNGINLFGKFNKKPVIGVSPSQSHPEWAFKEQGDFIVPFLKNHKITARSQELTPSFTPNGLLYLASPEYLRVEHSFSGNSAIPCHTSSIKESIDIDTYSDFEFAQHMLSRNY